MELLSPAGSMDALRAAVQNGADAVYLGLSAFNARRGAKNFTLEELQEAVTYCHVRGVQVHLAINILLSDREMLWAGRIVVVIIALVAVAIAANPASGTVMALVENAWGVFGAAFGPVIMLSLYWKRLNFAGALAGITAGALGDIGWLVFFKSTGVYEIIPGVLLGLLAAILVSLVTKAPSQEVLKLYRQGKKAQ